VRRGPRSPAAMPALLPDFMSFPVVAAIKQLPALLVQFASPPILRRHRRLRRPRLLITVSVRIADRMRKDAGNVAVGWILVFLHRVLSSSASYRCRRLIAVGVL